MEPNESAVDSRVRGGGSRRGVLSADGQYILVANTAKMVRRWDLATGKIDGQPWDLPVNVETLLVSSDGQQVVAAAGGRIHWREWPSLDESRPRTAEKGEVAAPPFALSPNGKLLFAMRDGKPHLFDGSSGPMQIAPIDVKLTPTDAAWNPAGDAFLIGTDGGLATVLIRTDHGWKEGSLFKHRPRSPRWRGSRAEPLPSSPPSTGCLRFGTQPVGN